MTWIKPKVTDVTVECREDVLAHCWSASEPAALEGQCPGQVGQGCPNEPV